MFGKHYFSIIMGLSALPALYFWHIGHTHHNSSDIGIGWACIIVGFAVSWVMSAILG